MAPTRSYGMAAANPQAMVSRIERCRFACRIDIGVVPVCSVISFPKVQILRRKGTISPCAGESTPLVWGNSVQAAWQRRLTLFRICTFRSVRRDHAMGGCVSPSWIKSAGFVHQGYEAAPVLGRSFRKPATPRPDIAGQPHTSLQSSGRPSRHPTGHASGRCRRAR